jgi:hypothetical protein
MLLDAASCECRFCAANHPGRADALCTDRCKLPPPMRHQVKSQPPLAWRVTGGDLLIPKLMTRIPAENELPLAGNKGKMDSILVRSSTSFVES